jgi:hypothetical protein
VDVDTLRSALEQLTAGVAGLEGVRSVVSDEVLGALEQLDAGHEAIAVMTQEKTLALYQACVADSFKAVSGMMVQSAERLVEDPKGAAFFMLMKTQIKWGADSMAETREQLLSRDMNGPYHTFIRAVENDIAAKRVRADVNPVAIAAVAVAIWDGLVQSKIERFLECDLAKTLSSTYEAMWKSIAVDSCRL